MQFERSGCLVVPEQIYSAKEVEILLQLHSLLQFIGHATGQHKAQEWTEGEKKETQRCDVRKL